MNIIHAWNRKVSSKYNNIFGYLSKDLPQFSYSFRFSNSWNLERSFLTHSVTFRNAMVYFPFIFFVRRKFWCSLRIYWIHSYLFSTTKRKEKDDVDVERITFLDWFEICFKISWWSNIGSFYVINEMMFQSWIKEKTIRMEILVT